MTMCVDKMTLLDREISPLFRTPSPFERRLGLWVDRIGEKTDSGIPGKMRVLGLYGFVQIIEGRGVFEVDTQSPRDVFAGDCLLMFPGVAHRYGSPGNVWTTRWIVCGGDKTRLLYDHGLLDSGRPVVHDTMGAVPQAHHSLGPLMKRYDPLSCLMRHNLICELLYALAAEQERSVAASQRAGLLPALIAYLDAHYREDIRPSLLARQFAVSYTHLRRLFRQSCGHGIKEYITQKRLSLAKHLLSENHYSIKQIASLCGYDDCHYFMRLFKARIGVTAGRFE